MQGLRREDANSASARQLENCDCDAHGRTQSFNRVFYQRGFPIEGSTDAAELDDILHYATRDDLRDDALERRQP